MNSSNSNWYRNLASSTESTTPPYCCVPYEEIEEENRLLSRILAGDTTNSPLPCCIPYDVMNEYEGDDSRRLSGWRLLAGDSSTSAKSPPVCCVSADELPPDEEYRLLTGF